MKLYLFAIIFFFQASIIFSKSFTGKVVAVLDGDTFIVVDSNNFQQRIRLSGVDAPEKNQNYGQKAKYALSSLIYYKTVVVNYANYDKYGRIIGLVYVNSENINEQMLKLGFGWAYLKYLDASNIHYKDLERNARNSKFGLWNDNQPIPPWEFRKY